MYIVLAILAFGLIIAVHELGHFFAAKAMNVKVLELSIGMGPKILSRQGKETLYSLRLIPFGGFCSMEGEYGERIEEDEDGTKRLFPKLGTPEYARTGYVLAEGDALPPDDDADDDDADDDDDGYRRAYDRAEYKRITGEDGDGKGGLDPRSFMAQKSWKRIVILAAGSTANFIIAFFIVLLLTIGADGFWSTSIAEVRDNLPEFGESEIKPGDKIIAINGERLYYYDDYALFMNVNADKPVTLTLLRDGETVIYQRKTYNIDGQNVYRYGLAFAVIEPTFTESLKFSAYQTFNFVRMIRVSISMMVSGAASVRDVAGPVGIVSVMNTVGQESPSVGAGVTNIVFLTAFIGVNVAAINLLPIPAMDGGRILFVLITWVVEKLTRKQLDPKYENYINTGAFVLLIGLMILIVFNDVMRLIGG